MDNSIILKELPVVNGALRKGDEGFGFFFFFKRVFFGWGREDGVIPPLSKGGFFLRDWDRWIFLGMGTNPKGCFLDGMGGKRLVGFQGRKVGFF